MKKSSTLFLQVFLALVGLAVLALMLWEPHLEGRNAHATTFEIYFKDPFLAYVYIGSTPFFIALYRAFGLLGHAGQTGSFSQVTVEALRAIKRCAIVLIGFVVGAVGFIIIFGDGEDRAGGIFMCFLAIVASSAIAITAALSARRLQAGLSQSAGVRL